MARPPQMMGESDREYRTRVAPLPRFEVYRGGLFRREWRWRYRARNGLTVFISSEGYQDKADARRAIEIAQRSAGAPVVEV